MAAYNFYTDTGKRFQITESVGLGDSPIMSDSDVLDILNYMQASLGLATVVSYASKDLDAIWFIEP